MFCRGKTSQPWTFCGGSVGSAILQLYMGILVGRKDASFRVLAKNCSGDSVKSKVHRGTLAVAAFVALFYVAFGLAPASVLFGGNARDVTAVQVVGEILMQQYQATDATAIFGGIIMLLPFWGLASSFRTALKEGRYSFAGAIQVHRKICAETKRLNKDYRPTWVIVFFVGLAFVGLSYVTLFENFEFWGPALACGLTLVVWVSLVALANLPFFKLGTLLMSSHTVAEMESPALLLPSRTDSLQLIYSEDETRYLIDYFALHHAELNFLDVVVDVPLRVGVSVAATLIATLAKEITGGSSAV